MNDIVNDQQFSNIFENNLSKSTLFLNPYNESKRKTSSDNEKLKNHSLELSSFSGEATNVQLPRTSIVITKDVNSRASSYYEESESHIPITYFMSIWSKLISQDLEKEKVKAKEIIKQYKDVSKSGSKSKSLSNAISFKWIIGCSCKHTANDDNNTRKSVDRNYHLEEEQILILALSFSPYSEVNPIHWEILSSVYKCCNLNENDNKRRGVPRYGKHWESIGFQSLDPSTDFRGSGIFGLCQLLFLVSSGLSENIKNDILRLSQDKIHNFPFAIVGINFTKMIIDRLRAGKLDKLAEKEKTYISVVNGIYRGIWIMFYKIWKSRKCEITHFASVLQELKKIIKSRPKYLLNMAIL
uniref:ELMO domain-containing protein n=1 Tax=Parastrongyloides trichosuri TaxID=131310 RepID=A0A0N4ZU43_PARTI